MYLYSTHVIVDLTFTTNLICQKGERQKHSTIVRLNTCVLVPQTGGGRRVGGLVHKFPHLHEARVVPLAVERERLLARTLLLPERVGETSNLTSGLVAGSINQ